MYIESDVKLDFNNVLIKPKRSVILKGQQLEQAVTAAALWIQGENRNNASLLTEAPSGWSTYAVCDLIRSNALRFDAMRNDGAMMLQW